MKVVFCERIEDLATVFKVEGKPPELRDAVIIDGKVYPLVPVFVRDLDALAIRVGLDLENKDVEFMYEGERVTA